MLYINGIPGSDAHVIVEHRAARPIPRRKTLTWDVPGRSGKIVRFLDAREDITLTYELAVVPDRGQAVAAAADAAVAWLSQPGLVEICDDTDPDVFYLGWCPGGEDLAPILHRARRAKVKFSCMPQRWLRSGQPPRTVLSGSTVFNPTANTAKPRLTLHGSGAGALTVGTKTLSVSECGGLTLDCFDCTASATVTLTGEWPELIPGENAVSFSGGITSVTLEPRWFLW